MRAGTLFDRAERTVRVLPGRVAGRHLGVLAVRSVRRFVNVRVTGLAAEMTYYTFLSLVPLLTSVGAGLGLLQRFVGEDTIDEFEDAIVSGVAGVLSEDLVADVVAPMIEALLHQERTGVAFGGLLVSIWVASRVFRAAIRALDDAYEVEERRSLLQQWWLSLGFMAAAVVMVAVSLSFLVVGPLLGGGRWVADRLGMGATFEAVWSYGRWPAVAAVSMAFLVWLYRTGPNVVNRWRDCLPGAVVATVALVAVAVGFQAYLAVAGPTVPDVAAGDYAVTVGVQLLGVLAATLLFVWASNISLILGGVVNAEWDHGTASEPRDPDPGRDPERSC